MIAIPGKNDTYDATRRRRALYLAAGLALLLTGFASVWYFRQTGHEFKTDSISFKSKKSIASGVPNTVVFEYDISKIDFDSAFIQHSWDASMRARVNRDNHFQTFIYYYPGYHIARLIVNDKVVKQEKVNISTNGWEAIVDDTIRGTEPVYIEKDKFFNNGALHVPKELIYKNNPGYEGKIFVNYFNVGNLKPADASDFILETSVKNNLSEGGLVCQYVQLSVICENGMISIPLCNPGCASNIHLHVSDVLKEGKKNDLTAFGTDLSDWRAISIAGSGKEISISIDKKTVYKISYTKDLGKIAGFHYRFYGAGSVDWVKVENKSGIIFTSDF